MRAQKAYELAHAEFMAVANDIPSQLPAPDGTARIVNAGKAYRHTMETYSRALREFNQFVASGTLPERLAEPERLTEPEHLKERLKDKEAAAGDS